LCKSGEADTSFRPLEDDFQEREPPRRALSGDRAAAHHPGPKESRALPIFRLGAPPVVGVGLEGEPKEGDALALQVGWQRFECR
jgi:hypothetical protein